MSSATAQHKFFCPACGAEAQWNQETRAVFPLSMIGRTWSFPTSRQLRRSDLFVELSASRDTPKPRRGDIMAGDFAPMELGGFVVRRCYKYGVPTGLDDRPTLCR